MHLLLSADVMVNVGRIDTLFFGVGFMHHIIGRHGVAALGAKYSTLKWGDAVALVLAVGTWSAYTVR